MLQQQKFTVSPNHCHKNKKINFAFSYYLNNNFQKSIPIFKEIIEKIPDDNFLKYHYGIALKSSGRYKSSKIILKNYITTIV